MKEVLPMGEKKRLFTRREDKVVDVDVEELEKEGNNRLESVGKVLVIILGIIGVAWTIFQIYTGFFGLLPNTSSVFIILVLLP